MKKYFVVDCTNPVPSFLDDGTEQLACPIAMRRRITRRLLENLPRDDGSTNIIVGVTRGNVSECETSLKIVAKFINNASKRAIFDNYCVLNRETLDVEAGLNCPPDMEGELHILSDRPCTEALFKDKNCWWNEHSRLKKSIRKITKRRREIETRRKNARR